MSTIALSDVSAALAVLFEDELVAQWNRATVLSKLLRVMPSNAHTINWDVKATDGSVSPASSAIADGDNVSTYNDDLYSKASLSHAVYSEAFGISGLALSGARATGNPAALRDLFGEKMMDAVSRLAKNLNSEFYSGSGASNRLLGLVDATNGALKASGTYAGIDKGSITLFAGNELLNGAALRPLSFQLMRDVMRAVYVASGEYPDLIVADPIQFARYGMLFGEQRRYLQEVRTAAGMVKLDGGFQALEFDGIPIVQDKDAPAGKLLFLNSRHCLIRQLPDALAGGMLPGGGGSAGTVRLQGTPEAQLGAGATSLVARINPLSILGDMFKFQILLYLTLQVRRPNACAILGDLVSA
jgi:hypothetical protein